MNNIKDFLLGLAVVSAVGTFTVLAVITFIHLAVAYDAFLSNL